MRILLALTLILGSASAASAQRPPIVSAQFAARVVVSDGVFRGEMPAAHARYAGDWPLVRVPARPLKIGVDPTVPEFRIRAWQEGQGARVLVFGVTVSGPKSEVRERQIASVFVPVDKYVEISATEKYRARRLTLTAYQEDRPMRPPYTVGTPYIDIPVRPWTPPQR